jgi:hypothetical protein
VIIDHFTKIAYFILLKDDAKKALDLVPIFTKEIWKYNSLLTDIILDGDTRFTSEFESELCKYLSIKQRLSSLIQINIDR